MTLKLFEIAEWLETLNENQREFFEERAGILEYDVGMLRNEAEETAMIITKQWIIEQT